MLHICIFIIIKTIMVVEARVFCIDSNATPWMSMGFSCPLRCENIVAIIERLRMIDYNDIVNNDVSERAKIMNALNDYEGNHTKLFNDDDITIIDHSPEKDDSIETNYARSGKGAHPELNQTIFRNSALLRTDLEKELRLRARQIFKKGTCSKFFKGRTKSFDRSTFSKKMVQKCLIRTSTDDDFVKKITDVLNKHASPKYKFTKEITSMLLKKTLGATVDHRQGIYSVDTVLRGIETTVRILRRIKRKPKLVVKLASKHCLNIFQPGCFCKKGFVEKSGACVAPAACVTNPLHVQYLDRILLN